MAKHLARIHGTEEDRVNCPFYYKIGACRHGDRCSRLHHKPAFSQTLLFKHLYQHPVRLAEIQQAAGATGKVNEEEALEDFLCFFEDMYMELSKCGRIEGVSKGRALEMSGRKQVFVISHTASSFCVVIFNFCDLLCHVSAIHFRQSRRSHDWTRVREILGRGRSQ